MVTQLQRFMNRQRCISRGGICRQIFMTGPSLAAGDRINGPAIVTEMDSTTLILPEHVGEIDTVGNILIRPA